MASRPNRARPEVETLQRVRRIETRITQTMIALGIHTDAQKPVFHNGEMSGEPGAVIVPSIHCSLKEIIDSVPDGWHGPFGVFIGTDKVAVIDRRGC